VPLAISSKRLGVAILAGALATGIFHVTRQSQAIAAALGVPNPSPEALAQATDARRKAPVPPKPKTEAPRRHVANVAPAKSRPARPEAPAPRKAHRGTAIAVADKPHRIVFRHSAPGEVVLTLQGQQLDVEFREAKAKQEAK